MLELLVVLRDVFVAVIISWMGLSEQPDTDSKKESVAAPSTSTLILK